MKTANYSEFRTHLKENIDCVIEDNEALVINRGKNTGVVLISLEEYNSVLETEYILSNPAVMNDIAKSRKEIAEGKGIEVDIDSL